MSNLLSTPKNLPVPKDNGECNHLMNFTIPNLLLKTTNNRFVDFSQIKKTVIFIYPMTARPDEELPDTWDDIAGARGCTPQACSFEII